MEDLQVGILLGECVYCRTATRPKCFATIFVRDVKGLGLSGKNLNWWTEGRHLEHSPRA